MQTLRREIHPEVRVASAKDGLVEYIASDESVDSYREVILASGWRFTNFQRNAPFVDSHDYSSIKTLLGQVVDFRVSRGKLVETVQWAKDVAENTLAQLGFRMTEAGFLKAVSVGFYPVRVLSPFSQGSDADEFRQAVKELGLDSQNPPRAIYTEQEQIELSACVIGANPNALAAAHKSGVLTESDLGLLRTHQPEFASRVERILQPLRRLAVFSPNQPPQKSMNVLSRNTDTHGKILDTLSKLQRGPTSESEMAAGMQRLSRYQSNLRRDYIQDALDAATSEPWQRAWWRGALKRVTGNAALLTDEERDVETQLRSAVVTGSGLGAGAIPEPVAENVFNLLLLYGAFRELGVEPMPSGKSKLAIATGNPDAEFIMPGASTQITEDTGLVGSSVAAECPTIASLVPVAGGLLDDVKIDFTRVLLERFTQGLAARLDHACFQGDGTGDAANGGISGIFPNVSVTTNTAAGGNVSIATLDRGDLVNTIGSVTAAALQRPCRWFVHPSFLPLLLAGDAQAELRLPESADEPWMLCGFPVVWTAAAPSTDAAGAQVALFGHGASYAVGIRKDIELLPSGNGAGFSSNLVYFRAVMRAKGIMRNATGFAILKTASA